MEGGFDINSGVRIGGQRENPEPTDPGAVAALPAPSDVPIVAPANTAPRVEADSGVMALAKGLGNIDFGALGKMIQNRVEAHNKLKEEQDRAAGQAQTALLLSQTGQDYQTLQSSGKIPASATPAFQLGASIAAAQAEFSKLRVAVMKRGVDSPDSPNFMQDADFMKQFTGNLQGVRDEAVVKYFLDPAQELSKDDATRQMKTYDTQQKSTFMTNAKATLENAAMTGDSLAPALNNGFNVLKTANQMTPENAKDLITALGPKIIESVTDPKTGQINLAKAGALMQSIGDTKIEATGGRSLSLQYSDAFEEVEKLVYGRAAQLAQAASETDKQAQRAAQGAFMTWLTDPKTSGRNPDGTLILPGQSEAIKQATRLGLDVNDAIGLYDKMVGSHGNQNSEDIAKIQFQTAAWKRFANMTQAQRDAYRASIPHLIETGQMTAKEGLWATDTLGQIHDTVPKSPFRPEDEKTIHDNIGAGLSDAFGAAGKNYLAQLQGAASKMTNDARNINDRIKSLQGMMADRVNVLAQTWIKQHSANFPAYQQAVAGVANDPSGPANVSQQMASEFMQANGPQLGKLLSQALASPNPAQAIMSLQMGASAGGSAPTQRVYTEPGMRKQPAEVPHVSSPKPKQQATTPHPELPNIAALSHQMAKAKLNIMDTSTPIYHWYSTDVRSRNPGLNDTQIMNRIRALPPKAIRQLQILFERQQNGGAQ